MEEGAEFVVVVVLDDPKSDELVLDEPLVGGVVPCDWEFPPLEDVSEDAGALEPGCSRATATAITAVAAVTPSKAPRVT